MLYRVALKRRKTALQLFQLFALSRTQEEKERENNLNKEKWL